MNPYRKWKLNGRDITRTFPGLPLPIVRGLKYIGRAGSAVVFSSRDIAEGPLELYEKGTLVARFLKVGAGVKVKGRVKGRVKGKV